MRTHIIHTSAQIFFGWERSGICVGIERDQTARPGGRVPVRVSTSLLLLLLWSLLLLYSTHVPDSPPREKAYITTVQPQYPPSTNSSLDLCPERWDELNEKDDNFKPDASGFPGGLMPQETMSLKADGDFAHGSCDLCGLPLSLPRGTRICLVGPHKAEWRKRGNVGWRIMGSPSSQHTHPYQPTNRPPASSALLGPPRSLLIAKSTSVSGPL